MLGAIIGDVAGSTYEVEEINSIKLKNINYTNRVKILDNSIPLFAQNSSYTDDSILTSAIAFSLITDKNYEQNLKSFALSELDLGLDKYGRNRFSPGFCKWAKGNFIGESYGNGCAMRISPIANYFQNYKEIAINTKNATYPSHNNIDSYKYTEMVSACIYLAKQKRSKSFIKKYIEKFYNCNLNFNLEELRNTYKFTSKVKDSVPQAIYCFLVSNGFEDSIRNAISIGGDSDTIAAITGSISEVYYGIDKKMIDEVRYYLPDYIIEISNLFYKNIGLEEPFKNQIQKKKSI